MSRPDSLVALKSVQFNLNLGAVLLLPFVIFRSATWAIIFHYSPILSHLSRETSHGLRGYGALVDAPFAHYEIIGSFASSLTGEVLMRFASHDAIPAIAAIFHAPPSASNNANCAPSFTRKMNSLAGWSSSRKVRNGFSETPSLSDRLPSRLRTGRFGWYPA